MTRLLLLLERLAALTQQALRENATRHGLQPVHLLILAYLERANRYSDIPIAIAEYLGITRGTLSQSLAVLEAKGLIERRPDAGDGRIQHIRASASGRALLAESWIERIGGALDALPEASRLEEGLTLLLAVLQRLNGQHAFGICRDCAHFLRLNAEEAHCGLTGEPLSEADSGKLCREWTTPEPAGTTP
jgi:DNA-binding MarR family transcriptional regulator